METPKQKRLHEYALDERPIKVERKWFVWICIATVVFVVIIGAIFTLIFMIRKGLI